jgi:quinol monooxygenase YgiN
MIELHLVLKAPPSKTRTLIAALQALAKSSRGAPGCMAVEVYKTVAVPRYICYEEIWESEEALRSMIVSRHFSQLAALMELSTEPPVCEF